MTTPAAAPAAETTTTSARASDRFGTRALWAAGALLLAAPVWLSFDSGGVDATAQAAGAVGAFALLGLLAVVAPWPLVERGRPVAALAVAAGLTGWTALSLLWTRALGNAVNDVDRVVFYLAAFALALIVMRSQLVRRWAPDALLWGIAVVALYALAGRLLPDVVSVEASPRAGDRLAQPLTYWNAVGILTGFGALLATAVASEERRPLAYRALACAAAVPCALACYLTFSRGSWAAAAAGVIVLLLVRPRVAVAQAAGLWVIATGVLALALRAFPAALHLDRGAGAQADDGRVVALIALALAAGAGFAFARFARGQTLPLSPPARVRSGEGLTPSFRGGLAALVVGLALAGGVAVSFASERTERISRSAERVTTLKTFRGDYWRVALDTFADHPLAGVGTASYNVEWRRRRDSPQYTFDAHSLYFESLAELGIVGFGLIVALWVVVTGGVRARWRGGDEGLLLAAAAAVLGAFAVHAGLDWDWEMPAVTLPALLLAAAVVQRPAADAGAAAGPTSAAPEAAEPARPDRSR